MKKIILAIALLSVLLLSSCMAHEKCAAYGGERSHYQKNWNR